MASFRRINGKWQAQVARRGVRKSKLFATKIEAKDWAAREEFLILNGRGEYGPGTLGDLFDRYAREVSPKKRGARWEILRLEMFRRDKLAKIDAKEARPGDFADWRDRRLKQVAPSTVRREMILMSSVMTQARKEWGTFPASPMTDVSKPKSAPPRDRLVTDDEIGALLDGAQTPMEREAARAFAFCCLSAMRAGEALTATLEGRVAHIPETKAGRPRNVPLSAKAVELFGNGFTVSSRQLDTTFRRLRDRLGIDGLTFHDSRHRAITDLSRKLDPLALARVVGHSDLSMLMTYYAASPEDLASRLD